MGVDGAPARFDRDLRLTKTGYPFDAPRIDAEDVYGAGCEPTLVTIHRPFALPGGDRRLDCSFQRAVVGNARGMEGLFDPRDVVVLHRANDLHRSLQAPNRAVAGVNHDFGVAPIAERSAETSAMS